MQRSSSSGREALPKADVNLAATSFPHAGDSASVRPVLAPEDTRRRLDEAVRRSWSEPSRRLWRWITLLMADSSATALAVFLTLALREVVLTGEFVVRAEVSALLVSALSLQPLTLAVFGAYEGGTHRISFMRVARGVATAVLFGWIQVNLLNVPGSAALDAAEYLVYAAWASVLIFLGRLLLDWVVRVAYRRGWGQRHVLVIGPAHSTWRAGERVSGLGPEFHVVGLLPNDWDDALGTGETLKILENALRSTRATGVVVAAGLSFQALELLVEQCFHFGVAVSVVPNTLQRLSARLELRPTRYGSLFQLHPRGLRLPQLAVKRAMDLLLGSVVLVVAAPVMVAIAAAIKLDSPGPVLFRQLRAGVGAQPFWMLKFRTMRANADQLKAEMQHLNESGDPRLFKVRQDPRITRVGRLLRRTSLDELPQLLNVFRGEMSLVGPRPFFPEDMEAYAAHHFDRLHVLPGITGLWQVSGRSSVVDFEEVVRLDRYYIQNWSIALDLKIMIDTVPAVMKRSGAY